MNFGFSISSGWGKEIHRAHDEYGPIRVFDNGNKLFLTFDSIHEQSCLHKDQTHRLMHEYTRAMLIPLVYSQPRHVTLLGLGGGALIHCLHHVLPEARLQVVELREKVVEIARDIFQLPDDPRVEILISDAGEYVTAAPERSTDFLLCDMYHAESMDAQQAQFDFIWHCHRLLTDDGWIAINYSHRSECTPEALDFIARHFRNIRVCTVSSGNQILLASKGEVTGSEREKLTQARELNTALGYPLTKYLKRSKVIKAG